MSDKVIAIVSGGLDSVTMAYKLQREGRDIEIVSFDYGQRHKKELVYANACARMLEVRHDVVDLTSITYLISNSALTSNNPPKHCNREHCEVCEEQIKSYQPKVEVPDGHYAEENMKLTVVPNRNMIMLSIAAGIAVNRNANGIATAVHAGDHFIYPDCRPMFIAAANAAIVVGNEGFGAVPLQEEGTEYSHFIQAPFLHMSKADIAYTALDLDVPLHMTWSCYKGGLNHCGRCGTCVERLEAIFEAQQRYTVDHHLTAIKSGIAPVLMDHTTYDDNEYWKTVTMEASK